MSVGQQQITAQRTDQILPLSGAQRNINVPTFTVNDPPVNNIITENEVVIDETPPTERTVNCADFPEVPIAECGLLYLYTAVDPSKLLSKKTVDGIAARSTGLCPLRACVSKCNEVLKNSWCTRHTNVIFNMSCLMKEANGQQYLSSVAYVNLPRGQYVKIFPLISFLDNKMSQSETYQYFYTCMENWMEVTKHINNNDNLMDEIRVIARYFSCLVNEKAANDPEFQNGKVAYEVWKNFMAPFFHSEPLQKIQIVGYFSEDFYLKCNANPRFSKQPWFKRMVKREGTYHCYIPFNFLCDLDKTIVALYMPAASTASIENDKYRSVAIPNVHLYNGVLMQGAGAGIVNGIMKSVHKLNAKENCFCVVETTNMVLNAIGPSREAHIVNARVNEADLSCVKTNLKGGVIERNLRKPMVQTEVRALNDKTIHKYVRHYGP